MEKQELANQIRQKIAELNLLIEESAKLGLTVRFQNHGWDTGEPCVERFGGFTVEISEPIKY